jgi:hypothetical protein
MEDGNARKRERVTSELELDLACYKRVRPEFNPDVSERVDSEVESVECERVQPELDPPEMEMIPHDILDILDDLETVTDRKPEIQDLDSVIKSFEEEIVQESAAVDSGELGYLLEASDDELGLPPAVSSSGEPPENPVNNVNNLQSESFGFADNVVFENDLPNYDPFEYAFTEEIESNDNEDFVMVGGLFDYSETSEHSWMPESLPAL